MRGDLDQVKPCFFSLCESIRGFNNTTLFAFGVNETDGSETDLVVNPLLVAVDMENPFWKKSLSVQSQGTCKSMVGGPQRRQLLAIDFW